MIGFGKFSYHIIPSDFSLVPVRRSGVIVGTFYDATFLGNVSLKYLKGGFTFGDESW